MFINKQINKDNDDELDYGLSYNFSNYIEKIKTEFDNVIKINVIIILFFIIFVWLQINNKNLSII